MKKKISVLSAAAIAAIMCVCACGLVGCGAGTEEATAYVALDINPSVELTLDKNSKVISVKAANEDGRVLLYGETDIVGLDVEKAVEKITSLAAELGYLDENNKVVQTTVTSVKQNAADLLKKVEAGVTVVGEKINLAVECTTEKAYSFLRKLEALKEKYQDSAEVAALTPEKCKLVLSAIETGEISVSAAAKMSESDLIKFVSKAHEQVENFATAAYEKTKSAASKIYDEAVGTAVDGIYTTYCIMHSPYNVGYAMMYQGYKTSARALAAVSNALVYAERMAEYPLTSEQVAAVVQALGLEDSDRLKNSDGEVTINSIYAYADRTFKNDTTVSELKEKLDAALKTAESELQAKIDEISLQYADEIDAVKDAFDTVAEGVTQAVEKLPSKIKEQMNAMLTDAADISVAMARILTDGKITSDEVLELVALLNGKADNTARIIEKDLTKSEIEEVKNLQEKALESLTAAKQQLKDTLEVAEREARARLEELKAARKA